MAITHGKEVAMFEAHDMRGSDVSILISLVWIVSGNASLCCERELGDNITDLVWLGSIIV
jgi:hypothetical protein